MRSCCEKKSKSVLMKAYLLNILAAVFFQNVGSRMLIQRAGLPHDFDKKISV